MIKKYNKFLESHQSPEDILFELSHDLRDAGLYVRIIQYDRRFRTDLYELFVNVDDNDKIFCKNYPVDDMDWLYDKPIINDFYENLCDMFNLRSNVDIYLYSGGTGVTFAFTKSGVEKIKL